jgi:predicted secreted protein
MPNRALLVLVAALASTLPLAAGEVDAFVNLGFSQDGGFYMYGSYGTGQDGSYHASLAIVDVARNVFVASSPFTLKSAAGMAPGGDPASALYALIAAHADKAKKYEIGFLNQGRLLFTAMPGFESQQEVGFRDFEGGWEYQLSLKQTKSAAGASFHVALSRKGATGEAQAQVLGIPGFFRKGVASYAIKRVIVSQDGRSLVCVIEKRGEDGSIGLMVEACRLPK